MQVKLIARWIKKYHFYLFFYLFLLVQFFFFIVYNLQLVKDETNKKLARTLIGLSFIVNVYGSLLLF